MPLTRSVTAPADSDRCRNCAGVPLAEVASRHGASGYVVESVPFALLSAQRIGELGFARLLEQVRVSYRMDTVALADGDRALEQVGPPGVGPPSRTAPAGSGTGQRS